MADELGQNKFVVHNDVNDDSGHYLEQVRALGPQYIQVQQHFLMKTVLELNGAHRPPFCQSKQLAHQLLDMIAPMNHFIMTWNENVPSIAYRPAWETQQNLRNFATQQMTNVQLKKPLFIKKCGWKIFYIANNIRWFCVSWAFQLGPNNVGLQYQVPNERNPNFPHKVYMTIDPNLMPNLEPSPRSTSYAIETDGLAMMPHLQAVITYTDQHWPGVPMTPRCRLARELMQQWSATLLDVMVGDYIAARRSLRRMHDKFCELANQCPQDPQLPATDFPNNLADIGNRMEAMRLRIERRDVE